MINSNHHLYANFIIYADRDVITSLDFSPSGELAATIDYNGVCLISDINTDNYIFHLKLEVSDSNSNANF